MGGSEEPAAVAPVRGEAVLRVEEDPPLLVVSDLHLGLGLRAGQEPRPYVATAEGLAERFLAIAHRERAGRLLLLGDVKHHIRGVPRPVRLEVEEFFGRLEEAAIEMEVVLGNHDAGLPRAFPPEVTVHGAKGLLRRGNGYFHGHTWPSRRLLLGAQCLVMGHLHPGYRFALPRDLEGSGKERIWVRTTFPPSPAGGRKVRHPVPRARTALVLPAFNPLCANESLNRSEPSRGRKFLVRRFLLRGESRAYLLDGTDLGEIPWGPPEESASGPGPGESASGSRSLSRARNPRTPSR